MTFSVKACGPVISRSWDDLVDHSCDDVSLCDKVVDNFMLYLPILLMMFECCNF